MHQIYEGLVAAMDGPGSQQRVIIALVLLAAAAVGVWATMEPGTYRNLAWVLLGFFAFRTVMARARAKLDEERR